MTLPLIAPVATAAAEETPASHTTGARIGRATLAYLTVVTLVITLAPFRFASAPVHGLTDVWSWSDIVLNVLMFMPLGFLYQLGRRQAALTPWWHVLLLGTAFSGLIESSQLFIVERYTSLLDVATNGLGAGLGALVFNIARRRVAVGAGAVTALALELPLMGLVYLLIPLLWVHGLASVNSERVWLLLLVAAFGGAVLGAVHGGYLVPPGRTRRVMLLAAAAGWFLLAALPGAARRPEVLLAGATLAVGVACLRSLATQRARVRNPAARRFEQSTLRLVMPLFVTYLALSALWPLDAADGVWRGGIALFPARAELSRITVLLALEHFAAFTLAGYLIAEYHGRDDHTSERVFWRVLRWGGGMALLLELVRGWHSAHGASVIAGALTVAACVFGGRMYVMQRDHVLTLLKERDGG